MIYDAIKVPKIVSLFSIDSLYSSRYGLTKSKNYFATYILSITFFLVTYSLISNFIF